MSFLSSMGVPVWFFGILAILLGFFFKPPPPKPSIVGMDLGTTFSGVAYFKTGEGVVEMCPVQGDTVIPSTVGFKSNGEVLVGNDAKQQDVLNAQNTVFDMKRFIGVPWSDAFNTKTAIYPYTLVNHEGYPFVQINVTGKPVLYSPQQIGSFILRALSEAAAKHIGQSITKVVMAVPVDFDEEQISATKEAATLAGLSVERVITEPTAAAMAYGLHENTTQQFILVFDMGGGTLDVSILKYNSGTFNVLAVEGDNHLGGEDVNNAVINWMIPYIKESDGYDVLASTEALQSLRNAVEQAKRRLSVDMWTQMNVACDQKYTFVYNFTREQLEELAFPVLGKMLKPVTRVFDNTGLVKDDIDSIVLVGGSTRIPYVRSLLKEFFEGRLTPYLKVPPEEAVAIGTGVQAGICGHMWPLPTAATENWELIKAMREYSRELAAEEATAKLKADDETPSSTETEGNDSEKEL